MIWDKGLPLANTGGPSGYLYNIHTYLNECPSGHIAFYSDCIAAHNGQAEALSLKARLKQRGIGYPPVIKKLKCLLAHNTRHLPLATEEIELLRQFDAVHFHAFIEARAYLKAIREHCPGLKVILTTHTPEPYCDEYCNTSGIGWILKLPFVRHFCLKREVECLRSVDFVMYPVPEVMEAYTSRSQEYRECFEEIGHKLFYVPTAILNRQTTDVKGYLAHLPDNGSLKVCYVGRHNAVKGYDFLKGIAAATWRKDPHVSFVIGGSKQGIAPPVDPRWIELGWVDTTELLNEVDVFVLPNKQTFYDLILLEVIRAGKPVLLTLTGGNKHFLQYDDTGLFFCEYGDTATASDLLVKMSTLKASGELRKYGMKNRDLFLATSTVAVYVKNYLSETQHILQ